VINLITQTKEYYRKGRILKNCGLPVCDKPYHTNKGILQKGEEIEKLQTYAYL